MSTLLCYWLTSVNHRLGPPPGWLGVVFWWLLVGLTVLAAFCKLCKLWTRSFIF